MSDGPFVVVWDIETVPDVAAFGRMQGNPNIEPAEAEALIGDKFPKLPIHQIVCLGALIAERPGGFWTVRSLGAPHVGARTEGDLIQAFLDRVGTLKPQLVTYNGNSFDLPVLRFRAMLNCVNAHGLSARPYFSRYTEDSIDLCDVLASFEARAKLSLDAICRFLGLAGKSNSLDGSKVAALVKEGRLEEVANYCETDVVNTYRVWLRYQLFRGYLTNEDFNQSELDLRSFLLSKIDAHPHLKPLM